MNNFDYDYNYDLPEDEYHGGNLVCEVLESHFYFYGSWWMIPILQVGKSKQHFHIDKSIEYEKEYYAGSCSICVDDYMLLFCGWL